MRKVITTYKKEILLAAIFVLAAIGLFDASYLTAKHFSGGSVYCTVIEGCDVVLQSQWARIFGIPTALYGVGYYLLLGGLAVWATVRNNVSQYLFLISSIGLIASGWFVYLQMYQIEAFCQYCLLSALISALVWGISSWLVRLK